MSSDSSSESDQEEYNRLKEAAIDVSTLNFQNEPKTDGHTSHLTSNRPKQNSHQEENQLRTTPEFRTYVAKHLSKIIESSISVEEVNVGNNLGVSSDSEELEWDSDFQLFSASDNRKRKRVDRKKGSASNCKSISNEADSFADAVKSTKKILKKANNSSITNLNEYTHSTKDTENRKEEPCNNDIIIKKKRKKPETHCMPIDDSKLQVKKKKKKKNRNPHNRPGSPAEMVANAYACVYSTVNGAEQKQANSTKLQKKKKKLQQNNSLDVDINEDNKTVSNLVHLKKNKKKSRKTKT